MKNKEDHEKNNTEVTEYEIVRNLKTFVNHNRNEQENMEVDIKNNENLTNYKDYLTS